eukprot:GHVS01069719.1.p1 GENE.GHVS01069719.1~~GHVS01069719.1.p1  ORF type:complete len:825 (+),score=154.77 GHVS01069719.1:208-2682(+)
MVSCSVDNHAKPFDLQTLPAELPSCNLRQSPRRQVRIRSTRGRSSYSPEQSTRVCAHATSSAPLSPPRSRASPCVPTATPASISSSRSRSSARPKPSVDPYVCPTVFAPTSSVDASPSSSSCSSSDQACSAKTTARGASVSCNRTRRTKKSPAASSTVPSAEEGRSSTSRPSTSSTRLRGRQAVDSSFLSANRPLRCSKADSVHLTEMTQQDTFLCFSPTEDDKPFDMDVEFVHEVTSTSSSVRLEPVLLSRKTISVSEVPAEPTVATTTPTALEAATTVKLVMNDQTPTTSSTTEASRTCKHRDSPVATAAAPTDDFGSVIVRVSAHATAMPFVDNGTNMEEELREVTDQADDETSNCHTEQQTNLPSVVSSVEMHSVSEACSEAKSEHQPQLPENLRSTVQQEDRTTECTYTIEGARHPQERNEQDEVADDPKLSPFEQKQDLPESSPRSTETGAHSNERTRLFGSPSSLSPSSRLSHRLLSPLPPTSPAVVPSSSGGPVVPIPFYVSHPPLPDPLESLESRKTFCITALRFLKHYCPHWAVHTSSFHFHFRALLSATTSGELQNYLVVLNRLRAPTPTDGSTVPDGSTGAVFSDDSGKSGDDILLRSWAVEEALEELDLVRSLTDCDFCPVRKSSAFPCVPAFSSLDPSSDDKPSRLAGARGELCEVSRRLLRGTEAEERREAEKRILQERDESQRKIRKRGEGELQPSCRQLREALEQSSSDRENEKGEEGKEKSQVQETRKDKELVGQNLVDGVAFAPVFSFHTALSLLTASLPSFDSQMASSASSSLASSSSSFSAASVMRSSVKQKAVRGRRGDNAR